MQTVKKTIFLLFVTCMGIVGTGAMAYADPSYDYEYKLVAFDALTKGEITLNTRQIDLGIYIINHSQNVPLNAEAKFTFTNGYLKTARGALIQNLETKNSNGFNTNNGGNYISRFFALVDINPTSLQKPLPKDVIVAHLTITSSTAACGVTCSTPVVATKSVEDVVYTFSNNELIPLVANSVINNKPRLL